MKRSRRYSLILSAVVLLSALAGCGPKESSKPNPADSATPSVDLYVLAAASLSDAMKELTSKYEASHPGQKLVISYGGSGTLQQQIEQGAPADLFISAAAKQMNNLSDKKLIDTAHRTDLLRNQLVLIIPKNSQTHWNSFADLKNPSVTKLAIGQPESVPAGTYAKQSLTNLGLWATVKPKLVFTKDVRQTLAYVETGNVDAGIVYKTDATSSDKVTIAATAEENTHSPIVYPMGVTAHSKHPKEAAELYSWLLGPDAASVFTKYGFDAAGKP